MKAIGVATVMLPAIAIAEIEFGMAKATNPDPTQKAQLRAFFNQYPHHLGFDDNTIEPYSQLRAEIWRLYATPKKRGHKERLPEQLKDRITGNELGIDERDLLIASVAAQYNLVLATMDQNAGMQHIETAANSLKANGSPISLRISYWN
ncbi:toxin-antitoxin system, toxin component, PIN family [Rhodopirellula sp. SWK7]|nr:type II toxin-antitoxin system VapC family toxin [Rhodopirellula sp. SWK7]EMI43648.1 toxin-antitoxin system, toxin component, PIN family [Rhodopirellula sp. SWK7]